MLGRARKEIDMNDAQTRLPLEPYIGSKIIQACPMTLTDYNATYNKVVPATQGEDGYVVFYPDGYISWSPKTVFEEAYRKLNTKEIESIAYYR